MFRITQVNISDIFSDVRKAFGFAMTLHLSILKPTLASFVVNTLTNFQILQGGP